MSVNYVNGVGAIRVVIQSSGDAGTITQTYDFPLHKEETEDWTADDVEGELIDLDTLQTSREYYNGYLTGTFDVYYEYLSASYVLQAQAIDDYQTQGYDVYLIPRVDRKARKYKVRKARGFTSKPTVGGTGAIGMKDVHLNFKTTESFQYGQIISADYDTIALKNFNYVVI